MHRSRFTRMVLTLAAAAGLLTVLFTHDVPTASATTFTNWLTRSYDNFRTSANLSEQLLTQANVGPNTFGINWMETVDDEVYAQPLYEYQVSTKNGPVNFLYVATANNTVLGLNADTGVMVWSTNLNQGNPPPNNTQVNHNGTTGKPATCTNNAGNGPNGGVGHVGIMSTPVIDPTFSPPRIFVLTHTMEDCSGSSCGFANMVYRLQALNANDGSFVGKSAPIGKGVAGFDPSIQLQRAGLALANGSIYIAFASYCDNNTDYHGYHGWVFTLLESLSDSAGNAFNSTSIPDQAGGIWQSGQAPAIAPAPLNGSSDVLVATGNGDNSGIVSGTDFNGGGNCKGPDLADAIVALPPSGLPPSNRTWTPDNFQCLENCPSNCGGWCNGGDLDVASSGPTLLPIPGSNTVQVLTGGKVGIYNLVYDPTNSNSNLESIQSLDSFGRKTSGDDPGIDTEIHNIAVATGGVSNAPVLYTAGASGIYACQINSTNRLIQSPCTLNSAVAGSNAGAMLTLSANSNASNTGILWVVTPGGGNNVYQRTLYALNADTLQSLWNSSINEQIDGLGSGIYWNPPTVVNGRVYVATSYPNWAFPLPPNWPAGQQPYSIVAYSLRSLYSFVPRPQIHRNASAICRVCNTGGPPPIQWIGNTGSVFVRSKTINGWGVPTPVTPSGGFPPFAGVAVAPQTSSQADLFVVDNNGTVNMVANANGTWQATKTLTGSSFAPAGAPLIALSQGGQTGTLVVDSNGALQIIWWNPVLGWLGPVALTGSNYTPPGGMLAAGTRSSGELDIFSIGTDGALKYMAFNNGIWTGPYSLTVTGFAPPGAPLATASDVNGFLNVFTVANDGALYTKWDLTPLWSGPTALTSTGIAPPGAYLSAINFANKSMNVFLTDNTGTIQALSNAGVGWQGPTAVGASGLAMPGGLLDSEAEGTTQLDLFAVSSSASSGMVESVNTGTGWSTPAALP